MLEILIIYCNSNCRDHKTLLLLYFCINNIVKNTNNLRQINK